MAKNRQKTSFLTALTAAWLTAAVIFAGVFVIAELGHDCTDEDCGICLAIQISQRLIEACGHIAAGFILAGFFIKTKAFIQPQRFFFAINPFALKVKLNC